MKLLFAHGWALDRTLWTRVIEPLGALAAGAVVLDQGYYGRPHHPDLARGERWLGVGQSLGALELLAAPPVRLAGVVAIDGFARFGEAADFPTGVRPRVLERMRARVADGALVEFLERAGGVVPDGTPDIARLTVGLDRLQTLEGRTSPLPVWRLQAADDPIALLAMADASFAGMDVRARQLREAGDHLSPIHAPLACATLIRAAVKALAP